MTTAGPTMPRRAGLCKAFLDSIAPPSVGYMSDETNDQTPDGSTDITEGQKEYTESLPGGADSDKGEGDEEQDTTSGGSPEE
jgi:hypothetical protein